VSVPKQAFALIRRFEGLRLRPYHDCAGFPTVGYGHLLSRERGAELTRWPAINEERAEALLADDAHRAARSVARLIAVPLTESRFGALVDFALNLGGGQLQASTLRRVINRGEFDQAPEQFMRWIYAGGAKLPGLVRRRRAEADLWAAGD
jgi:lysozyme